MSLNWSAHTREEWHVRTGQLRRAGFILEAMARDRYAADPHTRFAGDPELTRCPCMTGGGSDDDAT